MIRITLKELIEKMEAVIRKNKDIDTAAVVVDSYVVGEKDCIDYPPGSVVFVCESMNDKQTHELSIHPTKIGVLQ